MESVSRFEIKYLISPVDYLRFDGLFKKMLREDRYNGKFGYLIRSLYFDSIDNIDYKEKINGEEVRKKIRIRIYSPNAKTAKLEIKRKNNTAQVKESITISKADAIELINMNYSVLLKHEEKLAKEFYNIMSFGQYRPVVVVDYIRKAYIHEENSIRLTLDSEIRSSEFDFNIFSNKLFTKPLSTKYLALLEVKYDNDLFSWITNLISGSDVVLTSFSKYCNSRGFYENFIF